MQFVSAEDAEILKRSHTALFKAEVLDNGVPVITLPIQTGRVDVDGANAIRRKVSLSLVGDDLVPGDTRTGNIALKQPAATGGAGAVQNAAGTTAATITDGSTDTNVWTGRDSAGAEAWAQIDLGAVHLIDRVRVWHFFSDARTYTAPRTEVSLNGVDWTVVARPAAYAETSGGHLRRFTPIRARYVRDYVSGNSVNGSNHWVEVQVFAALDPLTPYGNEIRVMRGIGFGGVSETWWPLGVFGITRPSVSDTGENLLVTLSAEDRARTVQRARLRAEYVIAKGTNYATAIRQLIQDGVPFLTDFSFLVTSRTTPALTFEIGDDRWQRAQEMAAALGAELFFDPTGRCVLQDIQASETQPTTWDFLESVNLLGAVKELTADATYNVVVVSGESQDAEDGTPKIPPVRGIAEDTNPDSPTWVGGDFGRVVRFFVSPFITTQAQANQVAAALLERSLNLTERVVFDALPNPAAEAYDVVYVKATRTRINARYLLEAFTIPLNVEDSMTGSLAKRRTSGTIQ